MARAAGKPELHRSTRWVRLELPRIERSRKAFSMQSKRALVLIAALLVTGRLFAADSLMTAAQAQFKPIPSTPPAIPGNPASPAKVELGKMLYFDPRLSASHAISCNSCHNIGLGGVDAEPTSIGHRWQHGGRNAPTVFNAVFNTAQFWDGRAKDLEATGRRSDGQSDRDGIADRRMWPNNCKASRLSRRFHQGVSGRYDPDHACECAKGHRRVRGDADYAERAVRQISARATRTRSRRRRRKVSPCSWTRAAPPATTASTSAAACTRRSASSRSRAPTFCRRPTKAASR